MVHVALAGLGQPGSVPAIVPTRRTRLLPEIRVHAGKDLLVCVLLPLGDSGVNPGANDVIGACTCEEASDAGLLPTEVDFTNKA